jgi:hypothetical protein
MATVGRDWTSNSRSKFDRLSQARRCTLAPESGGELVTTRAKQIEVKLTIDGETIRIRFACRGHLATQSFPPTKDGLDRAETLNWLVTQFNEQLTKLKEASNGASR